MSEKPNKKPINPTINKPGLSNTTTVFIALTVLCVVFLGGLALFLQNNKMSGREETELYVQTGMDKDFFKKREKEKGNEALQPGVIFDYNMPEYVPKDFVKPPERKKKKKKKRKVKKQTQKYEKGAIIRTNRKNDEKKKIDEENQRAKMEKRRHEHQARMKREAIARKRKEKISKINYLRRNSSKFLSFKCPDCKPKPSDYKISQKEWKEPQTKASLPVNMERVITQDRFITAILINAINSQLAGQVTAQIETNVFGAHGRKILIPTGSKAIGVFQNVEEVGMERLGVIWKRIITPEGINIHLGNAEMTDQMGRSGITGEVDRRYTERYGVALLISSMAALSALSVDIEQPETSKAVEGYTKGLTEVTKQILQENMKIKPIIKIPPGSRIIIVPQQDIWFPEPEKKHRKKVTAISKTLAEKMNKFLK